MSSGPGPGLRDQDSLRTMFRVGGVICVAVGAILMLIWVASFASAWDDPSMSTQPGIWPLFLGVPLLGVGSWLLKAGFLGAGARFVAGELSPTARDTMGYLQVGGRQACPACGAVNEADATFCDACGASLRHACGSCGRVNDAAARFCSGCGTALSQT